MARWIDGRRARLRAVGAVASVLLLALALAATSAGDGGRAGLHPVQGRSFVIAPVSGVVTYRLPGKAPTVRQPAGPQRPGSTGQSNLGPALRLFRRTLVPAGTTIDATRGRVSLTSVRDALGSEQTAQFYDGEFSVTQTAGAALTTLTLVGNAGGCQTSGTAPGAAPGPGSAPRGRRRIRRLWGSGHGSFRTRGRWSSATVRGTIWLTDDSCDDTITRVRRGTVAVTEEGTADGGSGGGGAGGGAGETGGGGATPVRPVLVRAGTSFTSSSDD